MTDNTEQVAPASPKGKFQWGWSVVAGAMLALVLNTFFIDTYIVPSSSMEPTLEVGDYMLSIPAFDNRETPERGEVIVFHPPVSWNKPADEVFVKRVIAVGGDTIECCSTNGKVLLNGKELDEPYMQGSNEEFDYNLHVPEGTVFVLGDNRSNSADSRYHSEPFVPVENVIGQPFQLFYPFNHFQTIK